MAHPPVVRPTLFEDDSRRRPFPMVALAMTGVVLVIGLGAGFLLIERPWQSAETLATVPGTHPTSTGVAAGPAPLESSPAAGGALAGSTEAVRSITPPSISESTPGASTDPARAFGTAVNALVDRSASARGIVGQAATGLDSCQTSAASAASDFSRAQALRAQLAADVAALPVEQVAAVSSGSQLVMTFQRMQQLSGQADAAFGAWAKDVAAVGCTSTAVHTKNWSTGKDLSSQATAAKREFLALWAPVATSQGLPARGESRI